MKVTKIDAHQHFWTVDRGDYGWLTTDLASLYRDFGPADLKPYLDECGVEKTVLVQAAPTVAETRFLLNLASEHAHVGAVIGWVDMTAPDCRDTLNELNRHPRFRGVRPMIQDIAEDTWMLRPDVGDALDGLRDAGLVFEALVKPRHLGHLQTLLRRVPRLKVMVDHGAKPDIASGRFTEWAAKMAALARLENVYCKLSGLVTEAGSHWRTEDLRPYARHLLDTFGTQRLVWGSDWPVVNLAGGYRAWWDATNLLLDHLHGTERDAVLGGNAAAFYEIDQ